MIYSIIHYRNGRTPERVVVSGRRAMVAELRRFVSGDPGPVSIAKHFNSETGQYDSIAWRDWSRKTITWRGKTCIR